MIYIPRREAKVVFKAVNAGMPNREKKKKVLKQQMGEQPTFGKELLCNSLRQYLKKNALTL